MGRRTLAAWLVFGALSPASVATEPPKPPQIKPLPASSIPTSAEALSGALRDCLVQNLSGKLYEKDQNWGHKKVVAKGIKWTGKGFDAHGDVERAERNDGKWARIRVTAPELAESLRVSVQNVQQPQPGKTTFDVAVALDAHADYEQQNWKSGIRLYSGSARARMRLKAALACEVTSRIDFQKGLLPDLVVCLHVVKSAAGYEDFRLEHVAGIGGDAAKLIGDAARKGIEKWHPSLERKWIEKANAAIEKAGNNKEVRVGLGKLMAPKNRPASAVDAKVVPGSKSK